MPRRVPKSSRRKAVNAVSEARLLVACWTVCFLLIAGVALVFAQTYRHEFVNIDDDDYVSNNRYLSSGLTAEGIAWAFTTNRTSNWHPVTWVSLLLDAQCY